MRKSTIYVYNMVRSHGVAKAIETILEFGYDIEAPVYMGGTHDTLLVMAIKHGYTEFALELIRIGADFERKDFLGMNAISHAKACGNVSVANALVSKMEGIALERSFAKQMESMPDEQARPEPRKSVSI